MSLLFSSRRYCAVLFLITLLTSFSSGDKLFAGPSTADPNRVFEVQYNEMSQQYWDRSKVAIDIILMVTRKIEDAQATGNLNVVPPREVSEAYAMVEELAFCAGKLNILGEPCARHFSLFSEDAKGILLRFIRDYLELPNVKDRLYSKKSQTELKRLIKAQVSEVTKLQGMIRRQEWQQLDEKVHEISLKIWRYLCWYPDEKITDPVLVQIFKLRPDYADQINAEFKMKADEVLTELAAQYVPPFTSVLENMNSAVEMIAKNGKVSWNNQEMAGPEWITKFTEQVKNTQVEALKYKGIQVSHIVSNPDAEASLETVTSAQRKFITGVIDGFAKAIQNDAARVSGIEAETLYREYLASLTEFLSLLENDELAQPINEAMRELAGKSQSFSRDVAKYTDATGDLLRWRKRMATARAQAWQTKEGYVSFEDLLKSEKIGKLERSRGEDIEIDVRTWLDELNFMREKFVDPENPKLVSVDNLVLSEQKQQLFSPVQNLYCATVEVPKAASQELAQLMADLQANSSGAYPLTLEAQLAVYRALHYDYAQAGGVLTEVEFEGRVTQFAKCDSSDMARERLSRFEEKMNWELLQLRNISISHIKPKWVRTDYFFADVEDSP
ncbi:MAG: hypothetical protein KDA65_02770 [Planctomycetaceae bacterium]|nr:hypothetical protein [Planctomycetaceae bacterium]